MGALAELFEPSPESPFLAERRLLASWESLLRIKTYEEVRSPPPTQPLWSRAHISILTETCHAKLASY
jgi:hypothetical protein